jgi:hypothetical protein
MQALDPLSLLYSCHTFGRSGLAGPLLRAAFQILEILAHLLEGEPKCEDALPHRRLGSERRQHA